MRCSEGWGQRGKGLWKVLQGEARAPGYPPGRDWEGHSPHPSLSLHVLPWLGRLLRRRSKAQIVLQTTPTLGKKEPFEEWLLLFLIAFV